MSDWSAYPEAQAPAAAGDPWAAYPTDRRGSASKALGGPGGAAKAPEGSAHRANGSSLDQATDAVSNGSGGAVQEAMASQNAPLLPSDDSTMLPKIESTAAASFPKDPALKAQYLARSLFPDLSPNDALKRMGSDGHRLYYIANDGKAYYAEPSFNASEPLKTLAQTPDLAASVVGPAIPVASGIIGGVLAGPEPGSIATAAGAGMLGESVRQAGAELFAGEDLPLGEALKDAGKEGVLQGANQLAGLGLGKVVGAAVNANPMKANAADIQRLTPARLAEIDANTQLANAHGIPVTPAEAGNVRSLLNRQRQLLRFDESAAPMHDFYTKRSTEQIPDAWVRYLDNEVSPTGAPAVGNRNLANAAGDVIDSAKDARRAAAKPEYDAVMQPSNVLSPHDFNNFITSNPLFSTALQAVRRDPMLAPKIEGMPDASLPVLDLAKRWLDDQAGKFARTGDNTRAGSAGDAAEALRNALDPLFPGYSKARAAYAGASPEVSALEDGIVGLAGKDRASGLQGVSRTLFSAQSSDPVSVAQAKTAFIKAGKLDEWNDGLRAFLQNSFDEAAKQSQGPASSLHRTLMADKRQADVLRAAMTPSQWVAFNDLMKVVEMVKRAPGEGSATATDMGSRAAFAGPGAKAVHIATHPLNALGAIGDKVADWSAGKNIAGMVDVITDPNAVAILRKVQTMTPGTQRWVDELGALGSALGLTEPAPKSLPPTPVGKLPAPQAHARGGVVTTNTSLKDYLKADCVQHFAKGGVVLNQQGIIAAKESVQNDTLSGTGERHSPVKVTHADHAAEAGKRVDQKASPDQKEAGNYSKGHITWNGLSITIETPKGGTRKAKDGSWEVKDFRAHYGYVKRTLGADNDHVDVFFGDHPESKRVWIVDQVEPKTGKFDEHKCILAAATPKEARDLYCSAFTNSTGPSRIGAFTMMSIPQFKNWLKRGKRTKPVGKLPAPRAMSKEKA